VHAIGNKLENQVNFVKKTCCKKIQELQEQNTNISKKITEYKEINIKREEEIKLLELKYDEVSKEKQDLIIKQAEIVEENEEIEKKEKMYPSDICII
jgi:hypothetical protein